MQSHLIVKATHIRSLLDQSLDNGGSLQRALGNILGQSCSGQTLLLQPLEIIERLGRRVEFESKRHDRLPISQVGYRQLSSVIAPLEQINEQRLVSIIFIKKPLRFSKIQTLLFKDQSGITPGSIETKRFVNG